MAFTTDGSIISQVAAKVAADLVTKSVTGDADSVVADFIDTHKAVFDSILSLSGAESIEDIPAQRGGGGRTGGRSSGGRSGGRGGRRGGGNVQDHGAGVSLRFGEHSGETIEDIYKSDPEYVEWLADACNNDFVRGKAAEYLEHVGG